MKAILTLAAALALTSVVAVVVGAPETEPAVSDPWRVVSNVSQNEMADSHQPMMEQMRVSLTPQMLTLMPADLMRTTLDADMVTLMEQNQAQIDRMLARR